MLEALYDRLGFFAEVACLIGSVVCIYLIQATLKEQIPMVHVQRVALAGLALALLANGLFYYPSWMLIEGHRPTGAIVDIVVLVNLIIMAVRGYVAGEPGSAPRSGVTSPNVPVRSAARR